jgi:hypothetical protein
MWTRDATEYTNYFIQSANRLSNSDGRFIAANGAKRVQ